MQNFKNIYFIILFVSTDTFFSIPFWNIMTVSINIPMNPEEILL